MIQRIILINSANFNFADVDLSKDVFFLGDNAAGKTTMTRAIHYLYSVEGKQLGIPKDKDSFEKHYFPYENSYIFYMFDDFFITMFKRSGKVQKWFSKQVFNLDRIICDEKLAEHEQIRAYIKEQSCYRPQTNAEYRKIIYGQEKRFLDFSIALIKNYDAFLEVYNMVFNVDKSIVNMTSIKEAIQKSLQKEDEVLSLDLDSYIKDMEAFKRDYLFFKKFDKQRENIEKAVKMMDELIQLEDAIQLTLGKIKFNIAIDKAMLPEVEKEVKIIGNKFKGFKRKWRHWSNRIEYLGDKIRGRIADYLAKIKELEKLAEEYAPEQREESIRLLSQKDNLEKRLNKIVIAINELKMEQGNVIDSIEKQITQLRKRIKEDMPLEKQDEFRQVKVIEEQKCDRDITEIEIEYEEKFEKTKDETIAFQNLLEKHENEFESLKKYYESEQERISQSYEIMQENNRSEQNKILDIIAKKEDSINILSEQIRSSKRKFKETEKEYFEKRIQKAKILNEERYFINNEIKKAKNLLHHEPNSLKAFLTQEVEGWEENIYPVIDKTLLSMSNDILKPSIDSNDISTLFGLKIDFTTLETYPTVEELHSEIMQQKENRKISLQKARERDDELKAKLESDINKIRLDIDNFTSEIELEQKYINEQKAKYSELKQMYQQNKEYYEKNKRDLKKEYEKEKKKYSYKMQEIKQNIFKLKQKYKILMQDKKRTIEKRKKDLEFNIGAIKKDLENSMKQAIAKIQEEIQLLEKEKQSKTEDERIYELNQQELDTREKLKSCYAAETFLEKYDEKRQEIDALPFIRRQQKQMDKFFQQAKKKIKEKIEISQKDADNLEEIYRIKKNKLEILREGIEKANALNIDLKEIRIIEEKDILKTIVPVYQQKKGQYKSLRIDFKELINKLSSLEHNAIIDINLNQKRFDEVKSIRELEHIRHSLEDLQRFSLISYDNQKRSRHADFINYLNNIIPQKLGTFNDLEDNFEQQKNKINKYLNRVNFGAITNISLNMERSRNNFNTIAALMHSLNDKITNAQAMFENKESLFFDKPKSIQNIDEIIAVLGNIKEQCKNGAIHIFDTIDLTLSYVENGMQYKDKFQLKNDSSSGGNILLKVAIAISVLALFANRSEKGTSFFLIIDEISKLQHKNQEKLKQYINEYGFRTLFITPDPTYPDPTTTIHYMFRNNADDKGKLEIIQMNII